MDEQAIDLLNVLPRSIPEGLFKQKIGTGDFLNKLQEDGLVKRTNLGVIISKDFLEEHQKALSAERKKELHLDLINNYYIPALESIKIDDYDDLLDNYSLYLNLTYHYNAISMHDDAVRLISIIAKKMLYWGMKEVIDREFQEFSNVQLSKSCEHILTYYTLFSNILPIMKTEKDVDSFESKFDLLEETREEDLLLYLESMNLKGIFLRINKDIPKAITLYTDTMEFIQKQKDDGKELNSIKGKIHQNLCFCFQEIKETAKAETELNEAQRFLEIDNDPYELAKLYYHKALFNYTIYSEELKWVPCFTEASKHLEGNRFPDIERNLNNLLAMTEIHKFKRFENYFNFKLRALDCDLILYREYFAADFMSLCNTIINLKDEYKNDILKNLDGIIGFLETAGLNDEKMFMMTIEAKLTGKEYLDIKNKIKNQSLAKLTDIFLEE